MGGEDSSEGWRCHCLGQGERGKVLPMELWWFMFLSTKHKEQFTQTDPSALCAVFTLPWICALVPKAKKGEVVSTAAQQTITVQNRSGPASAPGLLQDSLNWCSGMWAACLIQADPSGNWSRWDQIEEMVGKSQSYFMLNSKSKSDFFLFKCAQ